jgi:hypothetical protein
MLFPSLTSWCQSPNLFRKTWLRQVFGGALVPKGHKSRFLTLVRSLAMFYLYYLPLILSRFSALKLSDSRKKPFCSRRSRMAFSFVNRGLTGKPLPLVRLQSAPRVRSPGKYGGREGTFLPLHFEKRHRRLVDKIGSRSFS